MGGVIVRSDSPRPPRWQHQGGQPILMSRHQDGSGSVAVLPVAETRRVVCSIVAAPMASPAPVVIGSRCPAQPVEKKKGNSFISNRQWQGKKARNVRWGKVGIEPRTLRVPSPARCQLR